MCSSTGLLPRCSDGSDHGVSQLRDILESLGLVSEQKNLGKTKKTKTPKKKTILRDSWLDPLFLKTSPELFFFVFFGFPKVFLVF